MRIGIDARPLCNPLDGIGRYTAEMIKRLSESEHVFFLYSDKAYDKTDFGSANLVHRVGKNKYPMLGSIFAQFFFPLWSRRDKLDLFWSPRHHLPLMLANKIIPIVTIHDLVWMYYGNTMHPLGYQLERFLMPRSIKMAKSIVAVSKLTRKDVIREFNLSDEKVIYIPHGSIGEQQIKSIDPVAVNRESFFLFVGTLEPRKNLEQLLLAYQRYLKISDTKMQLKIAGGQGWGNVSIEVLVNRFGLRDQVLLLGKVSDVELKELYQTAYALLMPSLYEGFGLPVAEAMSFGKPVIVSENSAMEEVAEKAAILINPLDADNISDAMVKIETDKILYQSLCTIAKRRASLYSWDVSSNELLQLFEKTYHEYQLTSS